MRTAESKAFRGSHFPSTCFSFKKGYSSYENNTKKNKKMEKMYFVKASLIVLILIIVVIRGKKREKKEIVNFEDIVDHNHFFEVHKIVAGKKGGPYIYLISVYQMGRKKEENILVRTNKKLFLPERENSQVLE